MADLKEMGTHLMQYRKAIALSNQNYADIRKIQEELREELGLKLSINQTVTLILKSYVSNNRNK